MLNLPRNSRSIMTSFFFLVVTCIRFFTRNPINKKAAMLEQLRKCYIYLIGLYMAIGETSLYKIT